MAGADEVRDTAEAGWAWVLAQVRDDDGPWMPWTVPGDDGPPWDRDGFHSGIGGLAHTLAEIRATRDWTAQEATLVGRVADRLRRSIDGSRDATFFDGLPSIIGALLALDAPGADAGVGALARLATPDGWPQNHFGPPRYLDGARISDATLGTAGVLLAALWALKRGIDAAEPVADQAIAVLLAEAEHSDAGPDWLMVPRRFQADDPVRMPNWSHGLAGIAASLTVAGVVLDRPDLVDVGRRGAARLVTLADTAEGGFRAPLQIPAAPDREPFSYGWCHGPTGTSLLFAALAHAGVDDVAGRPPSEWRRRCLSSVEASGLPARLRPGFWDNDGRCCGTSGVGDVVLDAWQAGVVDDPGFGLGLAAGLAGRAVRDGAHAYWRFVEHRAADPLLPPGTGWMQGAAGIAAFLFRADRVQRDGRDAVVVPRMETWWAVPPSGSGRDGRPAHLR